MHPTAVISARGARRWQGGHPWVFRSDVMQVPDSPPGAVAVQTDIHELATSDNHAAFADGVLSVPITAFGMATVRIG